MDSQHKCKYKENTILKGNIDAIIAKTESELLEQQQKIEEVNNMLFLLNLSYTEDIMPLNLITKRNGSLK